VALISARDLDRSFTLLDVRWELATGPRPDAYAAGHIPGAVFIDLDRDLAAPPGPGGRHPLPDAATFTTAMRRAGVTNSRPVVLYDGMAAARGWWVLRYFGHPDVRVLDGGLAAWVEAGGRLEAGVVTAPKGDFTAEPGHMPMLDADGAAAVARTGVLLDVRAPERYRGDTEPVDPVGGHIPGARNAPVSGDVDASGRFRRAPGLDLDPGVEVGVYCGSGVSAAQKVLALELTGIRAALYPGSWSEWITDPARPVARGD
jgi:thiosulfate/3-mercaptopyruvate sulfurtransferase